MRTYRNTEILGHKQDTQNFCDLCKFAQVDLTYIDSSHLEELFEDHMVMCIFTSCYTCAMRGKGLGITTCPRILSGVVGSSMNLKTTCKDGEYSCKIGLTKVNVFQSFDMFNGIFDAPNLIGINYQYHQSCILLVKLSAFYISRFGVCR